MSMGQWRLMQELADIRAATRGVDASTSRNRWILDNDEAMLDPLKTIHYPLDDPFPEEEDFDQTAQHKAARVRSKQDLEQQRVSCPLWPCVSKLVFDYQALDLDREHIRLFRVEVDASGGAFGQIERFPLETAPPYRALSYTWGAKLPVHNISINKQRHSVQPNLYNFLRMFAARHAGEYVWMDQVCIDQRRVQERNHQVKLMSLIYSRASEVIVWLAPPDQVCLEECSVQHFEVERSYDCAWVRQLLENEYWKRLWILQECLMATRICIFYGRSMLSWQDLRDIMGSHHNAEVSDQLAWLRNSVVPGPDTAAEEHGVDIAELYTRTHTSQCQDVRDHVFGVQGLLPVDRRVEVDYDKTAEEVYAEVFAIVLQLGSPGWIRAGALLKLGTAMGVLMPGTIGFQKVRSMIDYYSPSWSSDKQDELIKLLNTGKPRTKPQAHRLVDKHSELKILANPSIGKGLLRSGSMEHPPYLVGLLNDSRLGKKFNKPRLMRTRSYTKNALRQAFTDQQTWIGKPFTESSLKAPARWEYISVSIIYYTILTFNPPNSSPCAVAL